MAMPCSADLTEYLSHLLPLQLALIKLPSLLLGTITEEVESAKKGDRPEDSRGCVTAGLEPSTLCYRVLTPARLWQPVATTASRAMA